MHFSLFQLIFCCVCVKFLKGLAHLIPSTASAESPHLPLLCLLFSKAFKWSNLSYFLFPLTSFHFHIPLHHLLLFYVFPHPLQELSHFFPLSIIFWLSLIKPNQTPSFFLTNPPMLISYLPPTLFSFRLSCFTSFFLKNLEWFRSPPIIELSLLNIFHWSFVYFPVSTELLTHRHISLSLSLLVFLLSVVISSFAKRQTECSSNMQYINVLLNWPAFRSKSFYLGQGPVWGSTGPLVFHWLRKSTSKKPEL